MNLSGAARGASVLGRHARYLAAGLTGFTFADTFGDVIRNTIRQEQALAQVEARIRSTGNAAGPSSADIQRMGFPRTRGDRPAIRSAGYVQTENLGDLRYVLLTGRVE